MLAGGGLQPDPVLAARCRSVARARARIVLAEVVAARAPARLAELEAWRAAVLRVAEERRRQEALEAERAGIHATAR